MVTHIIIVSGKEFVGNLIGSTDNPFAETYFDLYVKFEKDNFIILDTYNGDRIWIRFGDVSAMWKSEN